jgi:hypothetical protein
LLDVCDWCPGTVAGAPVNTHGCPPSILADFNRDGAVDEADVERFEECAMGPALEMIPDCFGTDFDGDRDGDQDDFAIVQRCLRGSGIPADPACNE